MTQPDGLNPKRLVYKTVHGTAVLPSSCTCTITCTTLAYSCPLLYLHSTMPSAAFTAVTFGMSISHVRARKVAGVHHHTAAPSSTMTLIPLHEAQANPEIKYRGLYEEAQGPRVVELGMGIRAYNPVHGVTIPLVPLKEAQRNASIRFRGL